MDHKSVTNHCRKTIESVADIETHTFSLPLYDPHIVLDMATHQNGLARWLSSWESTCQAGDAGSIPGLERALREGSGTSFQYSPLEIPSTEEPGGLESMGSQSDMTE